VELTWYSETDGRYYLLLTDKKKLRAAEHMIDELIEYIHTNPDVTAATTILGEEIRRANRVNVTKSFSG
jgi:hypothetical protein